MTRSIFARVGVAAACVLSLVACGAGAPDARSPERRLPPYTGRAMDLFDDAIEPTAVGFNLTGAVSPDRDKLLGERVQSGDAVIRARVTTVTSRSENDGQTWQIGLHTLERVAGSGPLAADFTVRVASKSPAAGILRAFESRLLGKTFVAFVREFRSHATPVAADIGATGTAGDTLPRDAVDSDLHFHLAHDGSDEVNAILAAAVLGRAP